MADSFDPYYKWLGIPPQEQPPNHYRLLSINLFENDLDVIDAAADRQMAHLRGYQTGKHSAASQKLLNECSAARIALLNAEKKAEYDRQLREKLASVANAMRDVPGVSVGNALRGIPSAEEGSGFGVQGSAAEAPGRPAAALPRAKPLPQTQPPAEAAPLIDVGGSPSAGRPATRRRKARPAWQLPAAGAAAVVFLALVGWMVSRPAKKPKTAATRNVARTPTHDSTSFRPSAATATKAAAVSRASPVPRREASPDVVSAVPPAANERWQSFDLGGNEVVDDFVRVTQGRISTRESYTGPIEINVVVRPITNSIRLRAFQGGVIWNWEDNPSELRVGRPDHRIASAAATPLAANTWYRLKQRITANENEVYVDDKLVFHGTDGPYIGEPCPVWMETYERGSAFDVKSLVVTPLPDGDSGSPSPVAGNQLDIALAPGVTMKLVKIPASADGKIKSFYLGQTEVTEAQWAAVMGGECEHPSLPKVDVTFGDCKSFFQKLNDSPVGRFRLRSPTRDEAQLAIGDESRYGLDATWCAENSKGVRHAVATLAPNGFKLFDIVGNAWEYCEAGFIHGTCFLTPHAQQGFGAHMPGGGDLNFKASDVGFRVAADINVGEKLASAEESPKHRDITLAPGVPLRLVEIPASDDGKIKSFYLGQTEVTQKQWVAVMGSNPASHPGDNLPIPQVDAPSCVEFCKKVSAANAQLRFRLPTEVEWAWPAQTEAF